MGAVVGCAFLPVRFPAPVRLAGLPFLVAGAAVSAWGARELGRSFTPFPEPPAGAVLVESGPYRVVRHPIYAGGIVFFVGFSLVAGPPALAPTTALAVLWALKARNEERRLARRFRGYEAYRRRTRSRLVPGLF